jgi:hypothetical protein
VSDEPHETSQEINERFQRALERLRQKFDDELPPGQLTIEREERPER